MSAGPGGYAGAADSGAFLRSGDGDGGVGYDSSALIGSGLIMSAGPGDCPDAADRIERMLDVGGAVVLANVP
jgi:hypothetical protein